MDWISVEDRLPKISEEKPRYYSDEVLATDCKSVWPDYYHRAGFWWDEGENTKVTHWMPFPEMPKLDKCQ